MEDSCTTDIKTSFTLSSKSVLAKFRAPTHSGHTVLHLAVALNILEILSHLLKHLRRVMNIDASETATTPLSTWPSISITLRQHRFSCARGQTPMPELIPATVKR